MSAYRQAEKDMIALNTPELHHNKGIVSKNKIEKPLYSKTENLTLT